MLDDALVLNVQHPALDVDHVEVQGVQDAVVVHHGAEQAQVEPVEPEVGLQVGRQVEVLAFGRVV